MGLSWNCRPKMAAMHRQLNSSSPLWYSVKVNVKF
jgi:hypothetical protein